MSGLYIQPKRPWSCIRSNVCLHNVLNFISCILKCFIPLFRKKMIDLLTLSRGRGCVKEKHIGWHVIVCFISVCRQQNVGNVNSCQSSGFIIISILHVLFQNIILRDCLFEFITKAKKKTTSVFKVLNSIIKFSWTKCFEV